MFGEVEKMADSNYTLSLNRYRELKAFCRQYKERKNELELAEKRIFSDGGDVTSSTASRIRDLRYAIDLIEKTAMDTSPEHSEELLRLVTNDISVKNAGSEVTRGEFVDLIYKFYYLLSCRKGV